MKYAIVYLIRGKVEKYHQKLVRTVGPKFREMHVIESQIPSHVTLKYPFELNNSKKLEAFLKEFTKKQKIQNIKIDGFSNFNRYVAFLNIKFSRQSIKIQKELIRGLKNIGGIKFRNFDKKLRPHSTVAYGNTKKSFDGIWNYLKKLGKPKFNLKFDNISILKKTEKKWKVYKVFRIK